MNHPNLITQTPNKQKQNAGLPNHTIKRKPTDHKHHLRTNKFYKQVKQIKQPKLNNPVKPTKSTKPK